MSFFGFGPSPSVDVEFKDCEDRASKLVEMVEGPAQVLHVFQGKEGISGTATFRVPGGKSIEHMGIKAELKGVIELYYDRGHLYEFTSIPIVLMGAGEVRDGQTFDFDFPSETDKPYETYNGINVRSRYFVRIVAQRNYSSDLIAEKDFWVVNVEPEPEMNSSIKMEVGIEQCLHIEFEYNKSKYHLNDVVTGKIYFMLVRIRIKHMELAIIRRESAGTAANVYNEADTLTKFEVMDGAPVRGESIPVRLYLSGFELSPTYRNINSKFSVRYYLNLVLVDQENRRYFKQQEIVLWRKEAPK